MKSLERRSLSEDDKTAMLNAFNDYRRNVTPTATNMNEMVRQVSVLYKALLSQSLPRVIIRTSLIPLSMSQNRQIFSTRKQSFSRKKR
jgi:hypothetical protein